MLDRLKGERLSVALEPSAPTAIANDTIGWSGRAGDGSNMSKDIQFPCQRSYGSSFNKRETGITDLEARELIDLLGMDWASLVREARIMAKGL